MQRNQYWSNSRLANWIRGTAKPKALSMEDWRDWEDMAEQNHPFRYWVAEQAFDAVQNAIYWIPDKIYAAKYYINNRWITRAHALTAHPRDIKPGNWRDVGYRFLPCLFNELVDFVEVELAWWHVAWDKEARKKFDAPFWSYGWWRLRVWRCPEAGIDNLMWQQNLTIDYVDADHEDFGKPSPQSERAKEILDLYTWWTQVHANRVDPYEASGWSAYCENRRWGDRNKTPEDQAHTTFMLNEIQKMEDAYEAEDEAMMIRLIKIRQALWT